jgi:hypothetical protein
MHTQRFAVIIGLFTAHCFHARQTNMQQSAYAKQKQQVLKSKNVRSTILQQTFCSRNLQLLLVAAFIGMLEP